jgi:hypothetical protein
MNTSEGTGAVEAVIQADLVYARVSGTSLRRDLYTPSGPPSESCDSMGRGFANRGPHDASTVKGCRVIKEMGIDPDKLPSASV